MPLFFRRLKYLFYSPGYYEARLVREILARDSVFFKSLSEDGRNRMIKKSLRFMMTKRFIGMEGLEVSDEMIASISGTAAQLTFGLKKSGFTHFHTIKIFPTTFYSRMFDRDLKGGASVNGVLFFSWEDFKEGFAHSNDRYNLGLHEMAHALRVELRFGYDFDQWFADYTGEWVKVALPEFKKMRDGKTSFLREYAATNMEEFFSVCVEHFFEVPDEFKANLPDIYNHLCYLLKIDPSNSKNDYRLEPDFIAKINFDKSNKPIPLNFKKTYDYDSWHWSFNLIIFGLFMALPVIIIYLPRVIIHPYSLLFMCLLITYAISKFRSWFRSKGILLYRHLVMFAIFGVSLPAISFFLLTNRFINEELQTYDYMITGYRLRSIGEKTEFVFRLSGDAYDNHKEIRRFVNAGQDDYYRKARILRITTSKGVFGFRNVESRQLIIVNDTLVMPDPQF